MHMWSKHNYGVNEDNRKHLKLERNEKSSHPDVNMHRCRLCSSVTHGPSMSLAQPGLSTCDLRFTRAANTMTSIFTWARPNGADHQHSRDREWRILVKRVAPVQNSDDGLNSPYLVRMNPDLAEGPPFAGPWTVVIATVQASSFSWPGKSGDSRVWSLIRYSITQVFQIQLTHVQLAYADATNWHGDYRAHAVDEMRFMISKYFPVAMLTTL